MDKILLLENDPKVAQALQKHLEKHQYEMFLAEKLDDARAILSHKAPDAILVDLGMATPELLDFYQWLVEQPSLNQIPRIFMEGNETPVIRELKMRSRDTFLKKPIQLQEFFKVLREMLDSSKKGPSQGAEISETEAQINAFVGKQIGSAVIKREIGRGGMGAVFAGYQESLDRKVAIKIMLPDLVKDEAAIGRFRREALAIARLKSPHIVQVFDAGLTDENVFYIVMEFLDGLTLDEHLEQKKRLNVNKTVNIITQVAKGLYSAHESNLIHRDIKPSNLILAPSGHVTITDFGLVRHGQDMRFTQTGMVVGTPHYLSPEQAYGKELDHRSDIYSLGIVFYELLTGEVPFDSNNLTQVLLSHVQQPLPDPREKVPDIPESVVSILNMMAEKAPDDRFQDCRELFSSLEGLGFQTRFDTGEERGLNQGSFAPGFGPSSNALSGLSSGPQISIDSSMAKRLSSLKNVSLTQFNEKHLQGSLWLNEAGSVLEQKGQFSDEWTQTLFTLSGHAQQINSAVEYGEWQHSLFESDEKIMTIFPKEANTCAMLFLQTSTQTSMNLSGFSAPVHRTGTLSGLDPLEQILSVAGVEAALLFDENGQLISQCSTQPLDLPNFEIRLLPIVHILHTLPLPMVGLDCWFERGRVMIWLIGARTLFVLSNPRANKSMISILLGRQFEQLKGPMSSSQPLQPGASFSNTRTQTPFSSHANTPAQLSQSLSGIHPIAVEGPVLPSEVIEQIENEYAKIIGPVAKIAIKKQLKKMGFSKKAFPVSEGRSLLNALADRLESQKRTQFTDVCMSILAEHGSAKR